MGSWWRGYLVVLSMALACVPISAEAAAPCLDEAEISKGLPTRALVGRLQEIRLGKDYLHDHPAVSPTFYALDLNDPTCLNTQDGRLTDIRSVHVYSRSNAGLALLKHHRGKRVSVRFEAVFPEMTAHHHRPMIGLVKSVTPVR